VGLDTVTTGIHARLVGNMNRDEIKAIVTKLRGDVTKLTNAPWRVKYGDYPRGYGEQATGIVEFLVGPGGVGDVTAMLIDEPEEEYKNAPQWNRDISFAMESRETIPQLLDIIDQLLGDTS
jgi:hypothetical protein